MQEELIWNFIGQNKAVSSTRLDALKKFFLKRKIKSRGKTQWSIGESWFEQSTEKAASWSGSWNLARKTYWNTEATPSNIISPEPNSAAKRIPNAFNIYTLKTDKLQKKKSRHQPITEADNNTFSTFYQ